LKNGSYLVQGRADVDEITEKCKIKFPQKSAPYSISSFILHKLGRIPVEDETIKFPHCEIKIENIDNNMIDEIIITNKKKR